MKILVYKYEASKILIKTNIFHIYHIQTGARCGPPWGGVGPSSLQTVITKIFSNTVHFLFGCMALYEIKHTSATFFQFCSVQNYDWPLNQIIFSHILFNFLYILEDVKSKKWNASWSNDNAEILRCPNESEKFSYLLVFCFLDDIKSKNVKCDLECW